MSKPTVGAGWQRAVVTLAGTVVGVVVIGTLYSAQSVFIPVALAVFLTFLLGPLVNRFHQLGLPRTPSVVVSVLLTAAVLGGIGWVVTDQIGSLLQELPRYRQTVRRKVETIKQVAEGPSEVREMLGEIGGEGPPPARTGGGETSGPSLPPPPQTVVVEPQRAAWLSRLTTFLSPMLEYLGELRWRSFWSSSCC